MRHIWHAAGRWDALVAIGTLLLAGATVRLGSQARKQVELGLLAFEASIRPLLVDVAPEEGRTGIAVYPSAARLRIELAVRNAGSGVALLAQPPTLTSTVSLPTPAASVIQTAIPTGQDSRVDFEYTFPNSKGAVEARDNLIASAKFAIDIPVVDQNGQQPGRTSFTIVHVSAADTTGWFVDFIELYAGDANKPFAKVAGHSSS